MHSSARGAGSLDGQDLHRAAPLTIGKTVNWPSAARKLGERAGLDWLPQPLKPMLAEASGPLFVACSGGADSLFVLLLMWWGRETCGWPRPLRALHFDHALRGKKSAKDADFVTSVCEALQVPLDLGSASWADEAAKVSEQAARAARLDFFRQRCLLHASPPFDIVTGHHSGDVAETLLMRLARGSGLQGLCAPRPVSLAGGGLRFLRPLIEWDRARLRSMLTECGIHWREDASNAETRYHRNRLRHSVIPVWEAASDRPIGPGVGRSRRLLEEDWVALEECARSAWINWMSRRAGSGSFPLGPFRDEPTAIQRRLLQRAVMEAMKRTLPSSLEDGLLAAIREARQMRFSLGARWTAFVEPDSLRLVEARRDSPQLRFAFQLPVGSRAYLPNGAMIACELVELPGGIEALLAAGASDDRRSVYVQPPEKQSAPLYVRQRQVGDAFEPKGKSSPRKLSDLLIERKINVEERDQLPVVADRLGRIVWVPGLPPAAAWLLGSADRFALRLTYRK